MLRRIPRPRSSIRSKPVTTDAGEINIIEEDVEMQIIRILYVVLILTSFFKVLSVA